MRPRTKKRPSWDALFAFADAHDGYFTTGQAAEAGFSPQLLQKHIKAGRIEHTMRGVYRLVHYPAGNAEGLSAFWLWSNKEGVFSHETALLMYELSDVLPSRTFITLPTSWKGRRLRVPGDMVVYYEDVPAEDRDWIGSVPVTTPRRTLADCATDQFPPEFLIQAADQGLERGLVSKRDLPMVVREALSPYGWKPA